MSAAPSIIVPIDIIAKAERLIKSNKGVNIKDGIEILLQNDLSFGGVAVVAGNGKADGGEILQQGLSMLAKSPFDALDIPIGSKTIDIRKAYKKMALKYHPDKNPKTTALFQAIQTACDKLSDPSQRKIEESKHTSAAKTSTSTKQANNPSSKYTQNQRKEYNTKDNYQQKPHAPSFTKDSNHPKPQYGHETSSRQSDSGVRNEANYRSKNAKEQREAEERLWADNLARARKHRDDVLREGQRAYLEEQQRMHEAAKIKEKQRLDELNAARNARFSSNPTPTPDSGSVRTDPYHVNIKKFSSQQDKPSNMDGVKGVGVRYTANSKSEIKNQDGIRPIPNNNGYKPYIPVPTSLRVKTVGSTSVDLEWVVPHYSQLIKILFMLQWREMSTDIWQSTESMLKTSTCRKKNLLPGHGYEFRVRSAVDPKDGKAGDYSNWSNILHVLIPVIPTAKPNDPACNGSIPQLDKNCMKAKLPKNKLDAQCNDGSSDGCSSDEDILGVSARNAWMKNKDKVGTTEAQEVEEEEDVQQYKRSFSKVSIPLKLDDPYDDPATPRDIGIDQEIGDNDDWYDLTPADTDSDKYQHPVYLDPTNSSSLVGYLIPGMCVEADVRAVSAQADKNWMRVKFHKKNGYALVKVKSDWGWTRVRNSHHVYLTKMQYIEDDDDDNADDYDDDDDDDDVTVSDPFKAFHPAIDVWRMKVDPASGHCYYYNEATSESQWEAPEWVEETDSTSGAKYYVKLDQFATPLHSTWSKPRMFAKLVRE